MLPLSPEILRAAYDYLRLTPPYNRWGLPPGEQVKFLVTRHKDREGDCDRVNGKPVIRVSARLIGHTQSLMEVVGHEMIHVYLDTKHVRSAHGREFVRLAHQVCDIHGFDPLLFVGAQ